MKKMVIKNEDDQVIGTLLRKEDGSLVVKSDNQYYQIELEKIIRDITSRPIYVKMGRINKKNRRKIHELISIEIKSDSPDYFEAIRYSLWKLEIDKKGIFGKVLNE